MRKLLAAAAALCLAALIPATASAAVSLSLPAPTGPEAVGRTTLALTESRADPWVPESGPRRLMVTVYYPAVRGTGSPASYMDPAEAKALLDFAGLSEQIPADLLANARTWSRTGALPLPGRRPLVLLSPGFEVPRRTLTGLGEELASRGYVVAAVDHAYESVATKFPGGILPCAACDLPNQIGRGPIALSRGTDLSFVIDELGHSPLADPRRVAVVGHSMGGDAAATVMRADRRVGAGMNIDGPLEPSDPLDRPFLLFGSTDIHPPTGGEDPSWDAVWPHMSAWKRWLVVTGADHFSFTDLDALVEQAGVDLHPDLDPARGVRLTRAYVDAFADRHLRGIPQRLFAGPAAGFPEVTFQR